MISSEVQRTLVKSPPELWAELSDPTALAGHLGELGELGEIRITRMEAEQKVEWEAGATSGTVVIKPSGWGTKVKLTVTRALSQPDAGPADDDSAAIELKPMTDAPAADDPPTDGSAACDLPSETIDAAPNGETIAEPEPAAGAEPRPFTIPLTAAGSALLGGPHTRLAPKAADIVTEPEPESANEPGSANEPTPDHRLEPAPTPRRGFFARLFGRRHTAPSEHAAAPAPAPKESTSIEDVASEEPVHQPHNTLAAGAPPVASDPKPEAELPAEQEAEAELHAQPEASAESQHPQPQPHGDVARTTQEAQSGEPQAEEGVHAETRAHADEADEPITPGADGGISEEIRAAEEVAAEEVTAVLTGVLDRLGAAHHRPFSRS